MIQTYTPYIIVRRHPYEEPYVLQIEFLISNGNFSSKVDIYCNPEDLEKIGNSLKAFPAKIPDEYCYIYGSEDPNEKVYRFFRIKAYAIDAWGHCALQFAINYNNDEPDEGTSKFSIHPIDPAILSKLGDLFISFSRLSHLEFHWSPNGAQELFEKHQ